MRSGVARGVIMALCIEAVLIVAACGLYGLAWLIAQAIKAHQ